MKYKTRKKIQSIDIPAFTLVYGKNASGKTTFSRTCEEENYEVISFNTDFINKNVYLTTEDGEKTSSTNKENFSRLFIDEKIILERKNLEKLQNEKKQLDTQIKKVSSDAKGTFPEFDIDFEIKIKSFLKEQTDRYWEQIDYVAINELRKYSLGEKEFKLGVEKLKNEKIYNSLIRKLKEEEILNDIFFNDSVLIKAKITNYNNAIDESKDYFERFPTKKVEEWISDGLSINEGLEKCTFCQGNIIDNEYLEINKKILSNDHVKNIKKLYSYLLSSKEKCEEIMNDELYVAFPDIKENIQEAMNCIENIINSFENQWVLSIDKIKKIEVIDFSNKFFFNKLENYVFLEYIDDFVKLFLRRMIIIETINKNIENIDALLKQFIAIEGPELNKVMQSLGLDMNITIKPDNRSGKKIQLDGVDISKLSEGQRHKLALGIFIRKIDKITNLSDKIIIFDDPLSTLDIESYFLLKLRIRNLIGKMKSTPTTKLIILTHDIHYIYIQVSDMLDNQAMLDITKFMKFNADGELINEEIEGVALDDISFMNKVLLEVDSNEKMVLLAPMILKMFRFFLDWKGKVSGVPIKVNQISEMITELQNLNIIEVEEVQKLRDIHQGMCSLKGQEKFSVDIIKEKIEDFNKAMSILKVDYEIDVDIESDSVEINIQDIDTSDMSYLFDVLGKLHGHIIMREEDDFIGKYLSHPINQITRNIMSIDI